MIYIWHPRNGGTCIHKETALRILFKQNRGTHRKKWIRQSGSPPNTPKIIIQNQKRKSPRMAHEWNHSVMRMMAMSISSPSCYKQQLNWTRKSSAETLHTSGLQVIDSSMDLQFASGNLPSAAQLKWGLTTVKLAKEVTMIDHVSKLFDTTCT